MMSKLEDLLRFHINAEGLSSPAEEYMFHPSRKWRFDFAWVDEMIAVEIEGGTWVNGRHTSGSGFEKDCEKYNAAVLLGLKILRFTGKMIESGEAISTIKLLLETAKFALKDNKCN